MGIIIENLKHWFKNFKFSFGFVVKCIFALITLVYFVLLVFGKFMFAGDPTNEFWRSLNIFGTAGEYDVFIRLISYAIFLLGGSWAVRFLLVQLSAPMKKGRAIVFMFCSLLKYAAFIVLFFFVLQACGVDTTTILAGIGIVGLVVGLGAQPLISDIIAGLFIVFENVFDVGDIIVASGFRARSPRLASAPPNSLIRVETSKL